MNMGKEVGKITKNLTKSTLDPAGLFTSKDTTTVVQAEAPPAMPDPDGEAVAAAKRRKLAAMKQRGGRDSTILAGEDTLGGG